MPHQIFILYIISVSHLKYVISINNLIWALIDFLYFSVEGEKLQFSCQNEMLGFSNNTIFHVGKLSHKVQECKYFHYLVLMIYRYNATENNGILIKSPYTKHIARFGHKMFLDIKLILCYDFYNFFYMQDIIL